MTLLMVMTIVVINDINDNDTNDYTNDNLPLQINSVLTFARLPSPYQGSLSVWTQSMRDVLALQRRLS